MTATAAVQCGGERDARGKPGQCLASGVAGLSRKSGEKGASIQPHHSDCRETVGQS